MAENVKDQILGFLESRFPDVEIPETEDIFQLGFVNSLFAMELVMFIEKTFGVTIPNDELRLDNFRTVKSMAELVDRRTALAETAEV
ncbi:phosphopantetheine-binding protein [Catenulispora yoronensis]|uniref:Phosphopantetheine-binding protein n=1 Tax=Catenulispora yoronensis TaxID=450799 RepID=A0ABP5H8G5_9ACTN